MCKIEENVVNNPYIYHPDRSFIHKTGSFEINNSYERYKTSLLSKGGGGPKLT